MRTYKEIVKNYILIYYKCEHHYLIPIIQKMLNLLSEKDNKLLQIHE